jgi:hypothetical protein
VPNDLDICPGTVIPESVPTSGALKSNNWALLDDEDPRVFDQATPQHGPKGFYDLGDTAGCSCEQIVEKQELGEGHLKFGCSNGEMEEWVDWVDLP